MGQYLNIAKSIICSRRPAEKKAVCPAPRAQTQQGGLTLLDGETCTVRGNVVNIYHMRPSCLDAGHCLGLTQETDCSLYPVRSGWCRERLK